MPRDAIAERHAGFALGALTILAFGLLVSCLREPTSRPTAAGMDVHLSALTFSDLPGWADDDHRSALAAFRRSCLAFTSIAADTPMGGAGYAGLVRDWQDPCTAAARTGNSRAAARRFFEENFRPFALSAEGERDGLFTGYYEPQLSGSRTQSSRFPVPIYGRPADLVIVDLGLFRPSLTGERLAGRVEDGVLAPYPARADIVRGVLEGRATPLLYVDDPVDAFFLHIQGSGRVALEDGTIIRVGYDAQNGHPYTAIGRVLVDTGEISRDGVSMQSIRAWLEVHPDRADEVMNTNPSYVFFREMPLGDPALGAVGAQGVELTDEASLAVDRRFHALGTPMWVEATAPAADGADRSFRRLLMAQDTGGAIRGAIRGDVYWGHGAAAGDIAGRMQHRGRLYVLLPRALAARRPHR